MEFNEIFKELPRFGNSYLGYHLVDLHHSILVFYGLEQDMRRYGTLDFEEEFRKTYRAYMSLRWLDKETKASIKLKLNRLYTIVLHERSSLCSTKAN